MGSEYIGRTWKLSYRWYTIDGNIPGPVNTNRIDNITAGKYYLETKDAIIQPA